MSTTAKAVQNTIGAAYEPISFTDEKDWHEKRRMGIGGSDSAAILGLHPYKQELQLYMEKTGDIEQDDLSGNQRIEFGNRLEEVIGLTYADWTGRKIRRRRQILRSKFYPFMQANIDFDVVGESRGLECKNVDKDTVRYSGQWGEGNVYEQRDGNFVCVSECDEVPEYYLIQCMHYLIVTGYDQWDLAALVGGNDLRIYTIKPDIEVMQYITEKNEGFWNKVVNKVEPEIDLTHGTTGDLIKKLYPGTNGQTITLDEDALHLHKTLRYAQEQMKSYEGIVDGIKNDLKWRMKDYAKAVIPGLDGGYTRKLVKRKEVTIPATEYIDFRFSAKAGE